MAGSSLDPLHLAAQFSHFPGPPALTLPWLQLLARFHAFTSGLQVHHHDICDDATRAWGASSRGTTVRFDPCIEAEGQVAAMAVALQSFGIPLSHHAAQLVRRVQERACSNPPLLAAPVVSPLTPLLHKLLQPQHSAQATCKQGLQQRNGSQQQESQHNEKPDDCAAEGCSDLAACCFWLHGERLVLTAPQQWQQHVAQRLFHQAAANSTQPGCCSSSNIGASSKDKSSSRSREDNSELNCLMADLACDWCSGPLQLPAAQQAEAGTGISTQCSAEAQLHSEARDSSSPSNSISSISRVKEPLWGCCACNAAQYCSETCAKSAKEVHNANCW